MIESTKQQVEQRYTRANGYDFDAQVARLRAANKPTLILTPNDRLRGSQVKWLKKVELVSCICFRLFMAIRTP